MRDGLEIALRTVLGPVCVINEHSRPRGEACVLEVEDADGRRWIGKRHRRFEAWQRETRAYKRWTVAISDAAAELHSSSKKQQTLVISKISGRRAEDTDDIHRQAT